jgi:hypothetical protein
MSISLQEIIEEEDLIHKWQCIMIEIALNHLLWLQISTLTMINCLICLRIIDTMTKLGTEDSQVIQLL